MWTDAMSILIQVLLTKKMMMDKKFSFVNSVSCVVEYETNVFGFEKKM